MVEAGREMAPPFGHYMHAQGGRQQFERRVDDVWGGAGRTAVEAGEAG